MLIAAKAHEEHNDITLIPPHLDDIESLRREMRSSFHEMSERLKLLELGQAALLSKFDALLSLVNNAIP